MRHNVLDTFDLCLLHRHYDVSAGENTVEHGPVSSPWDLAAEQEEIAGDSVLPKPWRVWDKLTPLEFTLSPSGTWPNTSSRHSPRLSWPN